MAKKFSRKIKSIVWHLFILLIVVTDIRATSIRQIGFDDVVERAEFIFEGRVTASQSRWDQSHTQIQTFVTFAIDDVLKGDYAKKTITLRFSGGKVGDERLQIEGLIYPEMGEHGIYFVETLARPLVNPLVGWSQGHYKIMQQHGSLKLLSADEKPVVSIQKPEDPNTIARNVAGAQVVVISDGHSSGLLLGTQTQEAMSRDDFKRAVRSHLNQP